MEEYMSRLEAVLSKVLSARDSATVKSATDELHKVWYKQADTVPALVKILQVHPEAQMRQLAGVEVRKLLPRFWYGSDQALAPEMMEQIKASLLQDSLVENSDLVRHTVARIISAIARIDLDDNRWPQLLPELMRAAVAPDMRQREIATYVLYALLDSADYAAAASEDPETLLQLFSQTIKDPESLTTRVNTVLALVGLSATLDGPKAELFPPLVTSIVEVLRQCVDASDDKSSTQIFEALGELIDADAALLGPAFADLLRHMIADYALDARVDPETRVAALRVVATAASFRATRIKKMKLGPELTEKLVEVVAREAVEDDDDDEDDEVTAPQLALQALETLAVHLPPSQVIAPLLRLLPTLVRTGQAAYLRAAYLAFSATAEGAPEFVASSTETLLPWIVDGLQNENQGVRVAALYALCQLGESVGDKLGSEHATLIPLVYSILDSAGSIKVCRSACYALATILRTLKNEVLTTEYLPGLVPRLLEVVNTADNLELKGFVISTLGTAAEVAGRNYLPYFPQTIQVLEPFVVVPQPDPNTNEIVPEQAKLVSEALGTLSRLCCAIGAEAFAPYLEAWMKTALLCLSSKDATLREVAPLYISELAEVYKDAFGVYIPHIVPHLFEVLGQEEITFDDVDDDEEVNLNDGLHVNSALCIEKEFSLDCLGALWKFVPQQSMPYLADSLEQFTAGVEHFYDEVRLSALTGFWNVFGAAPSNAEVRTGVWSATTDILESESDLGVLSATFDLINQATRTHGAALFPDEATVQLVLSNVFEVVKKTHRVFDEFEEEPEEDAGGESSEASAQLVQTSLELLSTLAKALGEQFAPLFERVAEALQPYATSQIDSERETGVGAFADLVGAMEGSVTPWTSALLSAFGQALNDSSVGVRSVAAYGVGLLAAHSADPAITGSYAQLLEQMAPLLRVDGNDRAVANAAGAMARLALKHPEAVPLEALIGQLLGALPLKDAYEEYPPLLQLFSTTALPQEAKAVVETLWSQHLEAQQKDAVKSVSSLPADDPLGDEVAMQAWRHVAAQMGIEH